MDSTEAFSSEKSGIGRQEEALALLDALLAAPLGFAFVDTQFRYIKVNDVLCAIDGIPRERMLGRTVEEVVPHLWPQVGPVYRHVLESGIPALNVEVSGEMSAQRGDHRHWLCHYYPVRADDGQTLGVGIVVTDITARKRAEQSLARRASEQTALYEFTDRLHRAGSLNEVYDAALDSIRKALHCDRASILLFDDAGVMRFVAWRGLSDAYRQAVEGHSPWHVGEKAPRQIGIDDISRADLPGPLKALILAENLRALAFIPLVLEGKLIGKFMIYYDAPHAFPDEELDLALTIARQLAYGVERIRSEVKRRQAEQALRESEERLQNIFDQSTAGIAQADLTGRFVLVNQRFCEITGYTAEQLKEKTCSDITHPDDRACDQALFRRGLQERTPYVIEKRYLRPDGTPVWVRNSVSEIKDADGRPQYMLAVSIDITEHRRLETQQARLAAIVSSSAAAIVSKDLDGIVTSWNAAAERIYDWKAEEIIGKSKALVIPPEMPDELPGILRKVRAGERIAHYETRRVRKDGALIDVAISVSPVKDTQGRITGAATIVRDITEYKRTQRELQRRQEEVEALNARLQRAMSETHHRVKNNLQIISAMIDMQVLEYLKAQAVPLKELERLGHHIRTLAIVHDLLTRRLREEEMEQRVSAAAVVGQLLGLLEKTGAGYRLQSRVADVELLSKQAITLALIVNELVNNAIKHASGTVAITFEVDKTMGQLKVCDDGTGFPTEFDPIGHGHMGLDLVMSLVDIDLKGQIYFENREEGGACVRVVFSLSQTLS